MKKAALLLLCAAVGGGVWTALQPQMRYAEKVNELSRRGPYLVPVEGDYVAMLAQAAKDGKRVHEVPPPTFPLTSVSHEGRSLTVRPFYTEKEAPEGGVMSFDVMSFLVSAAADPKAEGVALNPGVPSAPYAVVLPKDQVLRMIDSLKRRGF